MIRAIILGMQVPAPPSRGRFIRLIVAGRWVRRQRGSSMARNVQARGSKPRKPKLSLKEKRQAKRSKKEK